jgi:hypothetical protein
MPTPVLTCLSIGFGPFFINNSMHQSKSMYTSQSQRNRLSRPKFIQHALALTFSTLSRRRHLLYNLSLFAVKSNYILVPCNVFTLFRPAGLLRLRRPRRLDHLFSWRVTIADFTVYTFRESLIIAKQGGLLLRVKKDQASSCGSVEPWASSSEFGS